MLEFSFMEKKLFVPSDKSSLCYSVVTLLNWHLLSRALGCWMVSNGSTKDLTVCFLKYRSLLLTYHGGSTGHFSGTVGRSAQGVDALPESMARSLGHMPLLGSTGGRLCGSWSRVRLINSNQKEWSFGKPQGGLIQRIPKAKALGGRGVCLSQTLLRESYQEPLFTCDSTGCYLGHM